MDLGVTLSLTQKQTLSLMQIQSLRILEMNTEELQKYCLQEQTENPLLEIGSFSDQPLSPVEQQEWVERNSVHIGSGRAESPEKLLFNVAQFESPSIQDQLLQQVNERTCPPGVYRALRRLVCLLDDNGFLGMDEAELPAMIQAVPADCEKALALLRTLEPAGVGARDLPHCLLLQLERYGRKTPLLEEILRWHFADIASGQVKRLSRELGVSRAEVTQALEVLRLLDPRPVAGMTAQPTEYLVPDILASHTADGWEIEINDSWCGTVHVNRTYLLMAEHAETEEERAYFTEKIRRARAVVHAIEQRRRTIIDMTRLMLERQEDFVLRCMPLHPLSMQEVAEALHIHISTVSRTVRSKYVQCPRGVIPLSGLLETAAPAGMQDGPAVGRGELLHQLRQLIEQEDASKPYSDAALAERLNELCGVQISRRTVAKYRQELHIKGAYERRATE
ncbi:MAG: RNA polymerase factor sigma-54 [Agathobaculum sp.]|jgi:RNA polymerase sigma-54 factor|uniref:RNA polymerase factor sigma-54 n=1 Tax=Agathobaculum sp. TaxID=2048138 RepID=UPI003D9289AD